jgi:NAD+--asparagine ADP-ribosyltransferase
VQCRRTGTGSGKVEVSSVDPIASMQAIDNPNLAETAAKVRDLLREVIAEIGALGSSRAVHQAHWATTKQAP